MLLPEPHMSHAQSPYRMPSSSLARSLDDPYTVPPQEVLTMAHRLSTTGFGPISLFGFGLLPVCFTLFASLGFSATATDKVQWDFCSLPACGHAHVHVEGNPAFQGASNSDDRTKSYRLLWAISRL